jgi:hypothetical protein
LVVFLENRLKAVVSTMCLAFLTPGLARAQAPHVENRCPQLSDREYEELDARVQLLLRSEDPNDPLPAIVCDDTGNWVDWRGKRLRLMGRAALTEEALEVIEDELHGAGSSGRVMEDEAVAAGEPVLRSPSGNSRSRPPGRRVGGGTTVGIETELPAASLPLMIGPAFSFAGSVGPIMIGGREAFRFSAGELNALLMDFEGMLAYGAPLDSDKLFGAEVCFGAEWMVLYPEGKYALATLTPIASLGLRAMKSYGQFGLWLGVDARFRLRPLSLPGVDAADVGASVTIGGSYAVWSRK